MALFTVHTASEEEARPQPRAAEPTDGPAIERRDHLALAHSLVHLHGEPGPAIKENGAIVASTPPPCETQLALANETSWRLREGAVKARTSSSTTSQSEIFFNSCGESDGEAATAASYITGCFIQWNRAGSVAGVVTDDERCRHLHTEDPARFNVTSARAKPSGTAAGREAF
ncbi:hypothetical protein AAFF_G00244520 [Aldrovandia affinis]|uniref:Uncharacterized protein n=1 Tax=Aldrovandia affinis TaxID=143900 RepID=A0AAD7W3Q5_9TELE|nr:hypothetical protein AAFF_G00244520 [Aldrovandia affinis]